MFQGINGYPNSYWGWGNEDDDLGARYILTCNSVNEDDDLGARYILICNSVNEDDDLGARYV